MSIPVFLELVEIRTKLASLFPFTLGVLFSLYYFSELNGINTLLFFVAMVVFDMATTAINNTMDYVKAKNMDYKDQENILGKAGLSVKQVTYLIVGMITFSALIGLVLVYRTNLLLLVIGAICFAVGILYTFGPFPISRMPLGEVMSGLTMGFGIFFIAVFINVPATFITALIVEWPDFVLTGSIQNVAAIFLASMPLVFTIANIMLANNICDYETDITNHRYTLTFYIGKPIAVKLYSWLYYGAFAATTLAVLLGVNPIWMLGIWLIFPIVQKNIRIFTNKQDKATTFSLAIKNLVIYHGMQIILYSLAIIFK
ncbi:1,4-dihydroxy-2-naphthoate polyprenyltransferase [Desemzia sp. RIT804]|uniref:1,4-dihydroxy-2-naphthoate polyprenyltransferase n=1 Tax=Desemzia sp. RIT 804 TaxID=2810209 RepID=UPI00194FD8F8|nr:1,4-dihydroxy-2-naphthoate polyprenyltransferase [Desemzia sp. RIT 804]MBM6615196.1 1,4-dihydroxy-2-naphthoate polyprenyltransferase [Desemzia sp. RIT 804]